MRLLFGAILQCLLIPACVAASVDCQAEYAKRLQTDLSLSYQEFDQTEGKGMRALAYVGCEKEAADLIVAYIKKNQATQISLSWHVAQLRASAGETTDAIQYARLSLIKAEDDAKKPMRWNDYVLATIAFLQKDKAAFLRHYEKVKQGKDLHAGNAMNLLLLDQLLQHFDQSYSQATMAGQS